jgi:hypothetical protein
MKKGTAPSSRGRKGCPFLLVDVEGRDLGYSCPFSVTFTFTVSCSSGLSLEVIVT